MSKVLGRIRGLISSSLTADSVENNEKTSPELATAASPEVITERIMHEIEFGFIWE